MADKKEIPELVAGDVIEFEGYPLASTYLPASAEPTTVPMSGKLTVRWWDVACLAVTDVAHKELYLVPRVAYHTRTCTIHRNGVQIYPKPEPSIEDVVTELLTMCRKEQSASRAIARVLMHELTITKKEDKL